MPENRPPASPRDAGRSAVPETAGPATWWITLASVVVTAAAIVLVQVRAAPAEVSAHGEVGALAQHAQAAHEELAPVLEDMEEFLPPDGSHPPLDMTEPSRVHGWRTAVQDAGGHLGRAPEGGAGYAVAREGLAGAVDLLALCVETYAGAAALEDPDARMDTLHLAMDLRDQAVRSWSLGATQLDLLDTGAGRPGLHLPGGAAVGTAGGEEPDGTGGGHSGH